MKKKIILFLVGFYPLSLLASNIFLLFFGLQAQGVISKIMPIGGYKNNSSVICVISYTDNLGKEHTFQTKVQDRYLQNKNITVLYFKPLKMEKLYDTWYFLGVPLMLTIFFIWFVQNYELLKIEEKINKFLYGKSKA